MLSDNLFKRVEKKTNVSKETILSLAKKLQNSDIKNEATIREVIEELSDLTGNAVSEEKKQKIVDAIINDKIPSDIENNFNNFLFLSKCCII